MAAESVLIVDDDARSLRLLRDLLTHHGYDVRAVGSGEQACAEVADGFVPALVMMDVHMPGMGGIAAIAALRAVPALAGARYIALTASVMPHQLAPLEAAGIAAFHTKPIDIDRLLLEVERLLHGVAR
jgi:two-component system cell cycle response regulator DivK